MRATITFQSEDSKFNTIYCHNIKTVNDLAKTLKKSYNTNEKISQLVFGGDISQLGNKINPSKNKVHNFDQPQKNVTVFYHRDRGEDLVYVTYNNLKQLMANLSELQVNVVYMQKEQAWYLEVEGKLVAL